MPMTMILVAHDLSARSDRALARALRLAHQTGRSLRLISVVDDDLPGAALARRLTEAEALLDQALVVAGARSAGIAVTRAAIAGDPAQAIPAEAHGEHAGLIVLGLHRPRPFLDALRETTMERVVRLIRLPVLLVRDAAAQDYARVLIAVSFSAACAAAVQAARMVAPAADLRAFHALHIPFVGLTGEGPGSAMDRAMTREAQAMCDEWTTRAPLPEGMAATRIDTGSFGQLMQAHIAEFRPDLLALGAHTRGGLALFALGSTTAGLIRDPPCDLLVARATPLVL